MVKLKTIDIHGKQYVEVNERLKHFRSKYGNNWSLVSDVVEITENRCVIKATILDEQGKEIATGIAYEKEGSSFINKTSFVENCETSAWGRALANLGIGIDTSVASSDEVANAIKNQKTLKKMTKNVLDAMMQAIESGKSDVVEQRMRDYKMTKPQHDELKNKIAKHGK